MKLSTQQQQAFDQIMAFKDNDEKRFVLGGYAGTGKSTLSRLISKEFGDTTVCAYTGKAANVLRDMGENASTVHGAIYTPMGKDDNGELKFGLDHESSIKKSDLVIVDEFSMLPEKIIRDIETLAKKVLYLGDPFQLPPVNGNCILSPNFFLEEIHRQALDSPIIRYATDVREGRALCFSEHPKFVYQPRAHFDCEDYEAADQIIVGYNKTRIAWNNRFRQKLGFEGHPLPCAGDKLICTKNNHERGLFNGMIGYAKADARQVGYDEISLDFEDKQNIPVWEGEFKGETVYPAARKGKPLERFDYAYAITCHKSQGSEFDNVLIYNQPIGADAVEKRRWLYTAITRGKKKVSLVQP